MKLNNLLSLATLSSDFNQDFFYYYFFPASFQLARVLSKFSDGDGEEGISVWCLLTKTLTDTEVGQHRLWL